LRKLLLGGTAALALFAGSARAGGLAEPVMDPVVVEDKAASSAGIVVPLLLLILVAAALSGGGSDGTRLPPSESDRRIKTDCQWVGLTADALPVWRYRYIGTPQVFEGVMAQDVAMRRPDAVVTLSNGVMAVNYAKLGLRLRRVA
jgi:hypothetical protein